MSDRQQMQCSAVAPHGAVATVTKAVTARDSSVDIAATEQASTCHSCMHLLQPSAVPSSCLETGPHGCVAVVPWFP